MVLRKKLHIQGNTGMGQGPSWAFNAFSAHQVANAIAERGLAPTVVTTTAEGAAAGATRGSWWGAAAGAALGIGLVTWSWWKSKAATPTPSMSDTHPLTPDQLRCLADPYNTSAECAAVRSILTLLPFLESPSIDSNAARASTTPETSTGSLPVGLVLPGNTTVTNNDLLPANAGAENVDAVRTRMVALYKRLQFLLGKNFWNQIQPPDHRHPIVRNLVLAAISDALLHMPITGSDGPPGARQYVAHKMYFNDPMQLRELGLVIHPDRFNIDRILQLTHDKFEMYAFEVRIPSKLMGFNLDGYGDGRTKRMEAVVFQLFDGGRVLHFWGRSLKLIATFKVYFDPSLPIIVDLSPGYPNAHDIDKYR